jgi:hypothetical protein
VLPLSLPQRAGSPPRTTPTNPHQQLDQLPGDPGLREELVRWAFSLSGVIEQPSGISVPGARAIVLADDEATGPPEAFMVGREFAHFHPEPDPSMHAILPPELASEAIDAGWAEMHPVARRGLIPATTVMLFAPRDQDELDVVKSLLRASYEFARPA